jgi:DNA-binding protein
MAEEPKRTERPPTQTRRSDIPPDTILIGKKPIMAYATAVMMHFNTGAKRLTLKARGRAISTAVDVAEVVNNRFFQVALGTEVVGEGQDARNVSTIEVVLERTK